MAAVSARTFLRAAGVTAVIGRERGEEGLRVYQEIQVLNITN